MIQPHTIDISSDRLVQWMNIVRQTNGKQRDRILECFWASQMYSKAWLINTLKSIDVSITKNVYIFGGWYGVLGTLINDNFDVENVYSIDLDPWCESLGHKMNQHVKFITSDMSKFTDIENAGLIINTSTEHIKQDVFDTWLSNMPTDVPIVLQGNDYFECVEHVRTAKDLEHFLELNKLSNTIFSGEIDCGNFNRYMTIGYK